MEQTIGELRETILQRLGITDTTSKDSEKCPHWKTLSQKYITIEDNLKNLEEIGDKCEAYEKNVNHSLCSIYFFNDLNHLIDYTSNGHFENDREDFLKFWNNILNVVKDLSEEDRKDVVSFSLDKNCVEFSYHEYGDKRFGYRSIGDEPPYSEEWRAELE